MSFLSNVLKVVGVVAAVASGGILAGAVIALASFAGGSVGKFMHSGWGRALTYAVAAGSAYASLGTAASAGATEQASTTSGFLDNFVSGAKSFVSALAHPIDTVESLFGSGSSADISGSAAGQSGAQLAANTSQVSADATADTAAAAGETGGSAAQAAAAPIDQLAQGAAPGTTTDFGAAAGTQTAAGAGGTSTNFDPESTDFDTAARSGPLASDQQAVQAGGAASRAGTLVGNSSSNQGGLMSKALKFAMSPGGGQVVGNVISGIGNGMFQNELMNKQIAAQNWGSLQWRNPALTAQVQAAAGQPLTVPTGYLSRANAVAALANGQQPATGPIMGPQPGGPGPGGAGTPMPAMPASQPVRLGGT